MQVSVAPSCVTSTRRSFTPMPPRRTDGPALAATWKLTVAPPCPAGAEVSAIQLTSGLAFQEHSRLTEMASVPSYNANAPGDASVRGATKNRVITEAFEPGSIMKTRQA